MSNLELARPIEELTIALGKYDRKLRRHHWRPVNTPEAIELQMWDYIWLGIKHCILIQQLIRSTAKASDQTEFIELLVPSRRATIALLGKQLYKKTAGTLHRFIGRRSS